jgi:hypothetical protein
MSDYRADSARVDDRQGTQFNANKTQPQKLSK